MMRLAIILSAFLLSACAAAIPVGTPGPDPTPTVLGEGPMPTNQIVVYRRAEVGLVTNIASAPAILLDGRSIGTCRVGQPILIRVPRGTWTITALTAAGEVTEEIAVRENDRVNLRCGPSLVPSLIPAPTLVPVGAETAQEEAGL